MEEEKQKKNGYGFGFRLLHAVIATLGAVACGVVAAVTIMRNDEENSSSAIFTIIAAVCAGLALLGYVCAFAGKKHKWANVVSIIIGVLLTFPSGWGLFAIIGGGLGLNRFKAESKVEEEEKALLLEEQDGLEEEFSELEKENTETPSNGQAVAATVDEQSTQRVRKELLTDYPVDYENKPAVSRLLDPDNSENLYLENDNGSSFEFRQLYVTLRGDKIYALTETVGLSEEEGGGLIVFNVDYENDEFHVEKNDTLCQSVLEEFKKATGAVTEKQSKKKGLQIFLTIIMLPVRAVIAFVKAFLSLLGEVFGDSSFGRAFKRGYNGDSYSSGGGKDYTYTDKYGNTVSLTEQPYVIDDRSQKVYKDKYGNEYVSDDGGKTIREYHRYDD